ncbi:MAG: TIGR00304 family protein [Methanobacterium sp. BRmetb2]|nr:MAG: TIGR00304 family protein [Methanobacterium sp. BRmetb2]
MIKAGTLVIAGVVVIFIGMILIFVGTALQSTNSKDETVKAGGVIMIGPIPIIFGTNKSFTIIAVIFAIILMVISYFLFYRPFL